MPSFLERLGRRKYVEFDHSPLPRVLGLVNLTALGIGSTIGVGIYVLAGKVALETAGPAVTVCFVIAAIASMFAGMFCLLYSLYHQLSLNAKNMKNYDKHPVSFTGFLHQLSYSTAHT